MQYVLIYAAGGLLYGLIEILWRGWTHWSMVLCGGLCFLVMYLISGLPLCPMKKCVLSSAAICTAEFYTGCLVNLRLGWNVWDYSAEGLNLLGQICPRFALLWFIELGAERLGTSRIVKLAMELENEAGAPNENY